MANPNIFQQYLRPPKSVMDYSAEMDAADLSAANLEGARRRNDLASLAMEQQRAQMASARDRQNALQRLYAGGGSPLDVARRKQADPMFATEGIEMERGLLANRKTEAETAAKEAETRYTAMDRHVRELAMVRTPEDVMRYTEGALDIMGVDPAKRDQVRQQMLAKAQSYPSIEAWKQDAAQGAIPVLDKFKEDAANARNAATNATSVRNNDATNATSRANNAATNATTMRGQNMTDARSRESNAAALTKPFELTGPDGLPVAVQQDRHGKLTVVEGFGPKSGSAKPLTEGQSKALLFGSRMRDAEKVLDEVGSEYSPAGIATKNAAGRMPLIGGAAEMAGNAMLSSNSQQVEQAQRDFINATLRRESGAVISDPEFENARKQYFPQPGDGEAVLKQKKANRELATQGILAEVPEGRRNSLSQPSAKSAQAPDAPGVFADAEKEARYQAWKKAQGK